MLFSASPWQSAPDCLVAPALVFHNVSPSSTASMAGLAVSSFCMARVSALTKSLSERRWSKGMSAARPPPPPKKKKKKRGGGGAATPPPPPPPGGGGGGGGGASGLSVGTPSPQP